MGDALPQELGCGGVQMIKCAVLGSPISHSLSPRLHRAAYEFLGVEGSYEALEMSESEFPHFFSQAREHSWTGFSLTMPLKERIGTEGIEIDPIAQRINSVNTLYVQNGKWLGASTDFLAFRHIFSQLDYSSVCVIGGGATARAALAALDGSVEEIKVVLRNAAKFAPLSTSVESSHLKLASMDLDLSQYNLVVSTVPAGASDQFAGQIPEIDGTLFDVLYSPWPTKLASTWHERGGRVINGFDLLVEQALDQVRLMTGKTFDRDSLRSWMNQAIEVERGHSTF